MGRFPVHILLTNKANMAKLKLVNQETTWESVDSEEPSAAPSTFFCFNDAQWNDNPDSETSPISNVSGRPSEDSSIWSCKRRKSFCLSGNDKVQLGLILRIT